MMLKTVSLPEEKVLLVGIDTCCSYFGGPKIGNGTISVFNSRIVWIKNGCTEGFDFDFSSVVRYGPIYYPKDSIQKSLLLSIKNNDGITDSIGIVEILFCFSCVKTLTEVLEFLLDHLNIDPIHSDMFLSFSSKQADQDLDSSWKLAECIISPIMLKTHITCIKFVGEFIFAGVGGSLHVFKKNFNEPNWFCVTKRQIFSDQNIYGMKYNNREELLVFGGRKMSLLRFKFISKVSLVQMVLLFEAQDWVLDCVWLEGAHQIAVLTANNAVLCYELSILGPLCSAISICSERCILYSGKLLNNDWGDLVVLAGTVFSTIIIWSNKSETDEDSKKVIHQLTGHKGVIFSVEFCERTYCISSTSDDRTVRLWEVKFNGTSSTDWRNCSISLKFSMYGHSARVWKSQFVVNDGVISVGEDSRICLWRGDGTLENQWSGHQNGEIWSLDVSYNLELIATGGSDGGVSLWPIKKAPIPNALSFEVEGVDKTPRCVGISDTGNPFSVNCKGDVLLYINSGWKCCFNDARFCSYCLISISPNRKFVALGSIMGWILICKFTGDSINKLVDHRICEGRIFSVTWLSDESIAICQSNGIFSIWDLSTDLLAFQINCEFVLPHSKERWITSCASEGNYIVCGDRCGSLFLYAMRGDRNPIFSAKKIHGHNGVTDVKFVHGKVASCGRDGKYREFVIENDKLLLVSCCKLKLDWAAAILEVEPLKRILVCFHEVHFIIWSVEERRTLLKLDCGGGHRSWDFLVNSSTNMMYMTYIKGKSVYYCCIPVSDILCQLVIPGSHPKAINAATMLPTIEGKVDVLGIREQIVLLGGEDTTLRLVFLDDQNQVQLNVLQSHLSSIRSVVSFKSHDQQVYLVSGGGRGQLVIWKVLYPRPKNNSVLEITELTSFSVMCSKKKGGKDAADNNLAEMRLMDLQVFQNCDKLIHVVAACSDGILRTFAYDVGGNVVYQTQEIDKGHCLLKILFFKWDEDSVLVSASTSGILSLYTVTKTGFIEPQSGCNDYNDVLVSSSGINSCDYYCEGDNFILSTGGDDAKINMMSFALKSRKWEIIHRWKNEAAHTCQISGLKMVDHFLFTSGLDQIATIFSWKLTQIDLHADLIARVNLGVPDIHGTLVWKKEDKCYCVYVYGLGSQLLEFRSAS